MVLICWPLAGICKHIKSKRALGCKPYSGLVFIHGYSMVVNVMDPDRVFKCAEFNLLLPMKGRGCGKFKIGGMNTGGFLPVLPMHFCSQLGGSGAFCLLTAENLSTSPLPSWDAAGSPLMSEPRVSLVTLSLWLQEKVLWLSAPVQPMSVLSLLTWDVSGLTVQKPFKRAQIVDCWCFLMPLLAYLVKGTSTYCTWR